MEQIEKKDFLTKAKEINEKNAKVIADAESKEKLEWEDTVQEIVRGDKYMIISYCKGNWLEFHIHTIAGYNEKEKRWTDGSYAYSLEGAMITYLRYIDSEYLKGKTQIDREDEYNLDYNLLLEISEKTIDLLDEDDLEDLCLEDKQKEYFGIKKGDEE